MKMTIFDIEQMKSEKLRSGVSGFKAGRNMTIGDAIYVLKLSDPSFRVYVDLSAIPKEEEKHLSGMISTDCEVGSSRGNYSSVAINLTYDIHDSTVSSLLKALIDLKDEGKMLCRGGGYCSVDENSEMWLDCYDASCSIKLVGISPIASMKAVVLFGVMVD